MVAITIHNEGAPLTAEQMDGLFAPMKGASADGRGSRTGPLGHLGLGLYIAERIADAHGGTIQVASSHASGTKFTLLLPRNAGDAA